MSQAPQGPRSPDAAISLAITNLSLRFGGVAALTDISLQVPAGQVAGLIGPNGSGKSSLLNCVSGVYRPQAGEIRIGDRVATAMSPHSIARAGVGRTFQHVEIPRDLTVLDAALLGREPMMRRHGPLAYALGIPYLSHAESRHRGAMMAVLEQIGLAGWARKRLGELPYGLAKRADLARALAAEPSLLLLDEPAAGLNQVERNELAALITRLVDDQMTVLLVEHDMAFVSQVCHRLIVLVNGQKAADGPTRQVLADPEVADSLLGLTIQPGPDSQVTETRKQPSPPAKGKES